MITIYSIWTLLLINEKLGVKNKKLKMWLHFHSEILIFVQKGNEALLSAWAWEDLGPNFQECWNWSLWVHHVPLKPTFRLLNLGKLICKMWETDLAMYFDQWQRNNPSFGISFWSMWNLIDVFLGFYWLAQDRSFLAIKVSSVCTFCSTVCFTLVMVWQNTSIPSE